VICLAQARIQLGQLYGIWGKFKRQGPFDSVRDSQILKKKALLHVVNSILGLLEIRPRVRQKKRL